MIEFGKITGNVEDGLVQVRLRTGECVFAPMAVIGNDVTIPSDEWISGNKDNFLALVGYEKDIWKNPIIVGFYPLQGYSVKENTLYKTLELVKELIDLLKQAKTLTLMGPQTFTPDTLAKLNMMDSTYNDILKDIRQ